MAPNGFRQVQLNFSGMGCWLTLAIGIGLVTTVGVGWLLKSLLALVLLVILIPVVIIAGAQFWLKRNLVKGACPACSQPLTGFKTVAIACPSCGIELQATNGTFARVTQEGTIDVDVVDVDVENGEATVVDVQVLPPTDMT